MNKIFKAIILTGGRGNRLSPITDDKPKCLLRIGGKTILQRQIETLRQCGITDISIVRGYKKELINYPEIRYYDDLDCKGILKGLFYAESEMDSDFIFSYSDILYQKKIVEKLLQNNSDVCLVTDRDWYKHYLNRKKHPTTEAEVVKIKDGKVIKIGKNIILPKEIHGEFIGLAKFSKKGAEIFKKEYQKLIQNYQNRKDQRFQNAVSFEKAYLTDMIQHLIDRGYSISYTDILGDWAEIDTDEDFERVREQWRD